VRDLQQLAQLRVHPLRATTPHPVSASAHALAALLPTHLSAHRRPVSCCGAVHADQLRCMTPALQTSLRTQTSRHIQLWPDRLHTGRAHRRLLPVHREEGGVKVHILQQLPKAARRAVQADRPPPVVLCDHVHAVGQVGPERRGALGLWEPARGAAALAPLAICQGCKSRPRNCPQGRQLQAPAQPVSWRLLCWNVHLAAVLPCLRQAMHLPSLQGLAGRHACMSSPARRPPQRSPWC